jgi:hypothetical protein
MPKVLRPRQEFPTPLFRLFCCLAAAVAGALPGLMFAGWDNGYTLALLLAAVVIGSVAAVRGRRLRLAATVAFLALIVVDAVALVIAFLTYPWE